MTDRSTVGVYFAQASTAQEILALPLTSPALPAPDATNKAMTFSQTIDGDLQVLALSPEQVPRTSRCRCTPLLPNGTRAPMIRLKHTRRLGAALLVRTADIAAPGIED